jgi:AraC-like DNA-binding protein
VLAEARTGAPLGRLAHTCGYADQAHLPGQVRELAGTTPSRLLRELAG